LLAKNLRVALCIDTEALGRVTLVMVGAMIVGRITVSALSGSHVTPGLHPITPPRAVRRGDEVGMFHLGSTTVVLVEPGHRIGRELGPVLCGESLLEGAR
jgi:phosphatidylserine decarboxylase